MTKEEEKVMQIAVYGKGGIGKSTVSANLSAALASLGSRVLQIGCDPKHDSTRLLTHGKKVKTVLDYILNTPPDLQKIEDVLMEGYRGTGCVEAGGPRPGMGCAGRGILTSFDFLEKYEIFSKYEMILFDVLGDVVCGGFAVPVRKQYADAVLLITSAESMSVYAANNILQGIKNLNPQDKRIAGIIYNSRGNTDDISRVEEFAQAVGLPVIAKIPRSIAFSNAERRAVTLTEADPENPEAGIFLSLAGKILSGLPLFEASPLSEDQMERFMRGRSLLVTDNRRPAADQTDRSGSSEGAAARKDGSDGSETALCGAEADESSAGRVGGRKADTENERFILPERRALSDPFSRVPMEGCSYRGALDLAVHVKDAAVMGHAPKSCTWIAYNGFSSYGRRGLFERGVLYPAFVPSNLANTDITVEDAIFGGVEHARMKAMELYKKGVRSIIVVTACIPGLTGDDLVPLKKELKELGCDMYIVKSDGVEEGNYTEGMALCYRTLAKEAVWLDVRQEKDCINVVYEHTIASRMDQNHMELLSILEPLGIRINCRFLCDTSMEEIHHFLRAPYSIMARDDALGREIKKIFETSYGCRFLSGVLPKGFKETAGFVSKLGKLYGKEEEAAALIEKQRAVYEAEIRKLRDTFREKKVLAFLNNIDNGWLLELMEDLELDIVKMILLGKKNEVNLRWNRVYSADWEKDRENLRRAAEELQPDVVLVNDPSVFGNLPSSLTVIYVNADAVIGFYSGIREAKEWTKLFYNQLEGRWRHDRSVFEKYYA